MPREAVVAGVASEQADRAAVYHGVGNSNPTFAPHPRAMRVSVFGPAKQLEFG